MKSQAKRPGEKQAALDIPFPDFMRALVDKKAEQYQTVIVPKWPSLKMYDCPVFLGSFSWTCPSRGERLLYGPTVVDIGYGPQSPGEVIRAYLDWKYPERLRASRQQAAEIKRHRSFPYKATRGEYPHMVYLDLKSAYWTITRVGGWDVDYMPGKWIGVSSENSDFPLADNKAARSALVTAGLPSNIRLWTGEKLVWKKGKQNHLNYGLWSFVMDTLHGVAHDMEKISSVYVHTDGYIIPLDRAQEGIAICASWGLKAAIKATGFTSVKGVGVYRVGSFQTKRKTCSPFDDSYHIEPIEKDWLRAKVFSLSKKRGVYSG